LEEYGLAMCWELDPSVFFSYLPKSPSPNFGNHALKSNYESAKEMSAREMSFGKFSFVISKFRNDLFFFFLHLVGGSIKALLDLGDEEGSLDLHHVDNGRGEAHQIDLGDDGHLRHQIALSVLLP
jgi:hypothetical protein